MAEQEEEVEEMSEEEEDSFTGKEPNVPMKGSMQEQYKSLKNLLGRPSQGLAPVNFEPDADGLYDLMETYFRVLVIGAGGLGCEILKNLALSGFQRIDVIDLDTIELSNLNRQFLFRKKDVGKAKSSTAAEFVMNRVPGVKIQAHHKPIQEFDTDFYQKFDVVIAGLDNIKARRWINAKLHSMLEFDEDGELDVDSIIPLIDGGTEGFKGHVRMIIPGMSSCFECSLDTLPPQTGFALCTIAGKPRKPEHCVAYAKNLLWPRLKFLKGLKEGEWELARTKEEAGAGVTWDSDNITHMTWMYQRALERAEEYGIEGVTYTMTMQVTKNIIPAIASTNALVSAGCVAEALKVKTFMSHSLNNWLMYMGQAGLYSRTIPFEKKETCAVCGKSVPIKMDGTAKLQDLVDMIRHEYSLSEKSSFRAPGLGESGKSLYMSSKFLRAQTAPNLEKTLAELLGDEVAGMDITVTDVSLAGANVKFSLTFKEGEFWARPVEEDA